MIRFYPPTVTIEHIHQRRLIQRKARPFTQHAPYIFRLKSQHFLTIKRSELSPFFGPVGFNRQNPPLGIPEEQYRLRLAEFYPPDCAAVRLFFPCLDPRQRNADECQRK